MTDYRLERDIYVIIYRNIALDGYDRDDVTLLLKMPEGQAILEQCNDDASGFYEFIDMVKERIVPLLDEEFGIPYEARVNRELKKLGDHPKIVWRDRYDFSFLHEKEDPKIAARKYAEHYHNEFVERVRRRTSKMLFPDDYTNLSVEDVQLVNVFVEKIVDHLKQVYSGSYYYQSENAIVEAVKKVVVDHAIKWAKDNDGV